MQPIIANTRAGICRLNIFHDNSHLHSYIKMKNIFIFSTVVKSKNLNCKNLRKIRKHDLFKRMYFHINISKKHNTIIFQQNQIKPYAYRKLSVVIH